MVGNVNRAFGSIGSIGSIGSGGIRPSGGYGGIQGSYNLNKPGTYSKLTERYKASVKSTTEMLSSMKDLSKAAAQLKNPNNGAWSKGEAASSDSTVLTASMDGRKTALSYKVDVSQVAAAQVSKSEQLNADELSGFSVGKNSLQLQAGGKTVTISADITETDTNQSALRKIATAINGAKSGVTATVSTENNKATLVLSGQSGEKNAFSLSGDAVGALGLNNTQEAQNAKYSVNGIQKTSDTNSVKLTQEITAQLKTAGTANVSAKIDTKSVKDSILAFAEQYNTAISGINKLPQSTQAFRLQSGFNVSNYNKSRLSGIGITVKADKTIQVDQSKLTAALEKNPSAAKLVVNSFASTAEAGATNALRTDKNSLMSLMNPFSAMGSGSPSGVNGYVFDMRM